MKEKEKRIDNSYRANMVAKGIYKDCEQSLNDANKEKQNEICEICKKQNDCNHRELIHKDGCRVNDCDCFEAIPKEKQIKEIQDILPTIETIKTLYEDIDFARMLYDYNCRIISENSVVLTKTEKQQLLKEMYEQGKFDALADLERDGKVVLKREEVKIYQEIYDFMQEKEIVSVDEMKTLVNFALKTSMLKSHIVKKSAKNYAETAKFLIEERSGIKGCNLEDVTISGGLVVEVLEELANKQFDIKIKEELLMDNERQIERIIQLLNKYDKDYDHTHLDRVNLAYEIKKILLPEDSVVLSEEEYENLLNQNKGLKEENGQLRLENNDLEAQVNKGSKETAERWHYHITTTLLALWKGNKITPEVYNSWIIFFNSMAKQYGVEIKEE